MFDTFEAIRQVAAAEATARLPRAGGKRFTTMFRHGSLQVEMFAPRGRDTQRPHDRDEIYVVVKGSGTYVNGPQRFAFRAGDLLFAAAGEAHRFDDFTEDFFTWVLFYGPEGGELAAAGRSPNPAP